MKVLLDVDGVVADFVGALLPAINSRFSAEHFKQWDLLSMLPPDEKEKAEQVLRDPEFWLNLPLVDGAKRGVQQLRDMGYEILWVTSPWDSCFGWDNVRREWISRNFGDRDGVVVTHDKENVDGDILIDDKPENVEKWQRAHPDKKAFLFSTPHNQGVQARRLDWSCPIKSL